MIGAALIVLWGVGAIIALACVLRCTHGWAEQTAGAATALLWPITVAILIAIIIHDWRVARRHPGRLL